MPTGNQIRAARALLKWDAADLAQKSKLTSVTVLNLETGKIRGRPETMDKIVHAFSEKGIEFLDNQGVRFRPQEIETFEGAARFDEFYDFIYHHLKQSGGNICIYGHSAKLFSQYRKDPEIHRNRMKELLKERPDFSVRTLQQEGDDYMPNIIFSKYRWQKKEYFPPTSYYVFGSCVALISFEGENPPFVILIKSALFAEAYLRSFNLAWDMADEPPSPKTKKKP